MTEPTVQSLAVGPRFDAPLPAVPLPPPGMRIPVTQTDLASMRLKGTPMGEIVSDLARFVCDPYGFVMWAFPWGQPGTMLADMHGPEQWQKEQLIRIGKQLVEAGAEGCVIQEDVASGHGVGKSTMVSWLIIWAVSTLEDTRGVVTANTDSQLRTKTWAELAKWHSLFLAKDLFKLTATRIGIANDDKREIYWRIDQVPWSKENTEAFAGLHNQGKRILLIFDEASAIDDKIWEVAEGALTDARTQIIWCRYGNPTRTSGAFFKNCLAAGTPVLTDTGWVPIEQVTPQQRVWDGLEWVAQKGALKSGHSFTLSIFNVRMTPDHRVLTTEGWVRGQACEGLERAEVRLPDGYAVPRAPQTGCAVGLGLRLRGEGILAQRGHLEGGRPGGGVFLRMQTQRGDRPPEHEAQHVVSPRVPRLGFGEGALPQAIARGMEKLRRTWYQSVRSVVGIVCQLLGRHGPYVAAGAHLGTQEQLSRVLAGELRLGNGAEAAQQHTYQHILGDAEGPHDDSGRGAGLWRNVRDVALPNREGLASCQGFEPVYDLIDCGPRSRFVVAGSDGRALIVHNCTQGKRNTYTRVDSRTVSFSNKKQIQAWIDEYGEDSDFVRVRVRGMFPRAGYANFISPELVNAARQRKLDPITYRAHQKVLSVDPARFGDDFSVMTLRQGLRVYWQMALSGFDGPDLAARIFEVVRNQGRVEGVPVEPGGIACITYDAIGNGADLDSALRRMVGLPPCIAVQWGQPAKDDKQYFNQRSECWGKMRDFLEHGQIPDDDDLANELSSLDYGYDARFRIQLQSKKDLKKAGVKSPDRADSLALSFIPELIDRKIVLAKVRPVERRKVVWSR